MLFLVGEELIVLDLQVERLFSNLSLDDDGRVGDDQLDVVPEFDDLAGALEIDRLPILFELADAEALLSFEGAWRLVTDLVPRMGRPVRGLVVTVLDGVD